MGYETDGKIDLLLLLAVREGSQTLTVTLLSTCTGREAALTAGAREEGGCKSCTLDVESVTGEQAVPATWRVALQEADSFNGCLATAAKTGLCSERELLSLDASKTGPSNAWSRLAQGKRLPGQSPKRLLLAIALLLLPQPPKLLTAFSANDKTFVQFRSSATVDKTK